MESTITSTGRITNQSGLYHAINPWETHYFKHTIEHSETKLFKETIEWSLSGNIPNELKIDNNGVITGKVLTFNFQDATKDNVYPKEKIKLDGSNWQSIGRFRDATYDFQFTVTHKYRTWEVESLVDKDGNELPTLATLKPLYLEATFEQYKTQLETLLEVEGTVAKFKEESVSSDVDILVIRNNNIDTQLFLEAYLLSNFTIVGDEVVKHSIYRNGKKYTYDTLEELKKEFE
jgi:hypothetical protein